MNTIDLGQDIQYFAVNRGAKQYRAMVSRGWVHSIDVVYRVPTRWGGERTVWRRIKLDGEAGRYVVNQLFEMGALR